MAKELSDRKKKILHALVDLYITTGQPVSSADIQERYLPDTSSATIRAELSALEALGYIDKPHTSSGRVPLKDAYKFYVYDLDGDDEGKLTDRETALIRNEFIRKMARVEDISKEAAKVISDVTNYTSFFIDKTVSDIEIEEVKLVPVKNNKALVLIVTDRGVLADHAITLRHAGESDYIESANVILNNLFAGRSIRDIERFDLTAVDSEMQKYRDVLDDVLGVMKIYVSEHSDGKICVEGVLKMLDYPEYNNVEDAKQFLSVITDGNEMGDLLGIDSDMELSVKIGKEDSGVDKCSIVTVSYKHGDNIVGQAGVIGPERMDYKRVIGILECMKQALNDLRNDED